jgi:hypothetical protein
MNKKIYLVKRENYNKLISDTEMIDNDVIIIVIESIEFIDDETFRLSNMDIDLSEKNLFYFDGDFDGYYNRLFSNHEYTYYCLDGHHYE